MPVLLLLVCVNCWIAGLSVVVKNITLERVPVLLLLVYIAGSLDFR